MRIVPLLLYAVGVLVILACTNPFSTRSDQVETPDVPANQGSSSFDPAIDPEVVFVNLKKALSQKNVDEYMRCFIGTDPEAPHRFHFEPEIYYRSEFDNLNWTLLEERDYFTKITKSKNSQYPKLTLTFVSDTLSLRPITPTSINDSLETNSLIYNLETVFSADSVAVYKGNTRFKLYRSQKPPETWHIYYWQDNALNRAYEKSWTYLKLQMNKSASR